MRNRNLNNRPAVRLRNSNILRSQAYINGCFPVQILRLRLVQCRIWHGYAHPAVGKAHIYVVALSFQRSLKKVHLRRAYKARHKPVFGIVVKIFRRVYLLNKAVLHYDNARAHCHCLNLVMRDVNKRCLQSVVQLGNFRPHLRA